MTIKDWHETGLWAVRNPTGQVETATCTTTPHATRYKHLQSSGSTWAHWEALGYRIVPLAQVDKAQQQKEAKVTESLNAIRQAYGKFKQGHDVVDLLMVLEEQFEAPAVTADLSGTCGLF